MTASIGNFRDLVRKAHLGELKLPGFQRNWRWRPDKVVKLYDSLRLRYPIGSFLFLAGSGENLAPRSFTGSVEGASDVETDFLVLDGQQRLTSGIHIFHATGPRQYYLDLKKLSILLDEKSVDLKDEIEVAEFCKNLDFEDGYIKVKQPIADPRALLVSDELLCTNILTNATQLNVAAFDYIQAVPEKADLMIRVVQPHFSLSDNDSVPHINIDEKTSISAISRIFTTLNTTGQMLTPFELVVASLFPAKIDLQKEVADFRDQGIYYPNMDKTGEILLQTIAMLADVDQKKSNLPKSINPTNYTQHKSTAFNALEELGAFLTDNLGCGLNATTSLVPYDAIYAPMARALMHVRNKGLPGPDLAEAHRKLRLWFAASALTQRYQEGVHNKQTRDFREVVSWIDGGARPLWIDEARTPSLTGRDFEGAVGKFIQCCINLNDPRDPVVVAHKVGFRSGAMTTEKHHVFPTRYVQHLADWDKKVDKANHLLNMMFVERETNKRWLNHDPRDHVNEALKAVEESELRRRYADQFIPDAAFEILRKPEKSRTDLHSFMGLRQIAIQDWIKGTFGIGPLSLDDAPSGDDLAADEELLLTSDEG